MQAGGVPGGTRGYQQLRAREAVLRRDADWRAEMTPEMPRVPSSRARLRDMASSPAFVAAYTDRPR